MSLKNKPVAIAAALFCMILWASAVPMIKTQYALFHIPPNDIGSRFLLAGLRFFISGIMVLIYFKWIRHQTVTVDNGQWGFLLKIALIQITAQYMLYYLGLAYTQGVKAAVIQSFNALLIVIMSVVMISAEHFTTKKVAAIALGTVGLIIANAGGLQGGFTLRGEGAILSSTILNAYSLILVKRDGVHIPSPIISIVQFLVGSLPLIVLGLLLKDTHWQHSTIGIISIFYGGFVSATAFTLWYNILKIHSSSEFGFYKIFVPIFGSMLSMLVLGEVLSASLFIGLCCCVVATGILNIRTHKRM
ncbi:DMT family transporter [Peptoniphilus equinus]|uniref:DMT family transporter n=1 Tax=Peptoniphilus equinus TaxID=3016343 RepID=A0ABY7QVJ6_9FIRM|nr:DMT family transporter [Peptoniphilus equinus]WBW50742.1 DMT family transporter [Peptoniphilus equinus]